jgi:glucose/mannose-6-phosphate isomerase
VSVSAAERLDDLALLEKADPGGLLRQVASSAAQVRTSARVAAEADLGRVIDGGRPRAIVVTGMGGSGIAGDVLAAVCGQGCPSHVATVHDYQLPGWVGAADLVIAVSCSGATEETLSAAADAVRRGCPLVGVGGADSPLSALAEQASAPFVAVQSAGMPRSTLSGWVSLRSPPRATSRPPPSWKGSPTCAAPTASPSSTRPRPWLWIWLARCR